MKQKKYVKIVEMDEVIKNEIMILSMMLGFIIISLCLPVIAIILGIIIFAIIIYTYWDNKKEYFVEVKE